MSFFFFTNQKKEQKALIFGERYINKNVFHKNKKIISIDKVDIKRIVLSEKGSYDKKCSFKYSIGYRHVTNAFPVPLCIKLP